jgi:hypothetical protein
MLIGAAVGVALLVAESDVLVGAAEVTLVLVGELDGMVEVQGDAAGACDMLADDA